MADLAESSPWYCDNFEDYLRRECKPGATDAKGFRRLGYRIMYTFTYYETNATPSGGIVPVSFDEAVHPDDIRDVFDAGMQRSAGNAATTRTE